MLINIKLITMKIIFFCEASLDIGTGHVMTLQMLLDYLTMIYYLQHLKPQLI